MRILYVPFFSSKNLGGCSIFNAMKVLLRGIVESDENVFVYYLVPANDDFDIEAATYIEHPRIKQIPVKAFSTQEIDMVFMPTEVMELFNATSGKYAVDLILTDKQRISLWLKMMVNSGIRSPSGDIPIVTMSQFQTGSVENGENIPHSEEFFYSQILGWYAGWNLWQCPQHLKDAIKLSNKYAKPHVVDRIIKRSHKGWVTLVSVDRLRPYLSEEKSKDEIVVHYGSRMGSTYYFHDVFHDIDRLYQAGRPVKLLITSPSVSAGASGGKELKRLSDSRANMEVVIPCKQEEFYRRAAQAHVSLWIAPHSGPSLSIREQAYLGQVIVAPRRGVYELMFPDYPYLYSSVAERQFILRHVVENYWSDEVQEVIAKYRKHIEDNHDIKNEIANISQFLRNASDDGDNTGSTENILKDVLEAASWPEQITLSELRALVRKETRIGRDIEVNYTGTNRVHFIRAMRMLGYVDDYQTEEIVWHRSKVTLESE